MNSIVTWVIFGPDISFGRGSEASPWAPDSAEQSHQINMHTPIVKERTQLIRNYHSTSKRTPTASYPSQATSWSP